MIARGDLVFVGDVHIDRDDPDLPAFLAFLDGLAAASRVVLMGDLFNLWIGREEMEQDHHRAVAERLAGLRRAGVRVSYVEGNRDYRVGPLYVGTALDEATDDGFDVEHGGRRMWAAHGDLVNRADRQYRAWRRLSRTRLAWSLLLLVPRGRRVRLAERLERRMRRTNLGMKREFPERTVREYARPYLESGFDEVVLGHFHVEKDLDERGGRILVLADWKSGRRVLRVGADGKAEFV